MGFTALVPTPRLGSYNRTGPSIALGGSGRASAGRIYHFCSIHGKGPECKIDMLIALNQPPNPYLIYPWRKFLI